MSRKEQKIAISEIVKKKAFVKGFFPVQYPILFSRLVQLDKLRLQTRGKEEEQALARGGKDPFIVVKNPSASKGGVAETSIKVMYKLSFEN